MISSYALSIPSSDGPVPTVVHLPLQTPAPVVVCCHGLLSYKGSTKFVAIGEQFSQAGLAVVRFDFAGCGESRVVQRESLLASRLRTCARYSTMCGGNPGLMGGSAFSGPALADTSHS